MSDSLFFEPLLRSFCATLSKEAAPGGNILQHLVRPGVRNAVGAGIGAGAGLGLGAGALAGGAGGARGAYQTAREEGAGVLSSAGRGALGALGGAVRGAAKGAVLGAGIGGLAGAAAPTRTLSATKSLSKADNALGSLTNFGQRQLHSLSGWKPGGSARSVERIGAGAADARRELGAVLAKGDPAAVAQARKALGSAEKAQEMGMTSLPGLARSVRDNGLLPTVGAGLKSQWDASSGKGRALMLGLPAASLAGAVASRDKAGGPGKGERIGRIVGGTLGGAVAPLSLAGGVVLGSALERAGGAVGKGVDRLRGRRPEVPQEPSRPPASEPGDSGTAAPVERVYGTGFGGGVGGLE